MIDGGYTARQREATRRQAQRDSKCTYGESLEERRQTDGRLNCQKEAEMETLREKVVRSVTQSLISSQWEVCDFVRLNSGPYLSTLSAER